MKLLATLVLLAVISSVAVAQSFVSVGPQVRRGGYGLYDVPNSTIETTTSVGAFVEAQKDWKAGSSVIAARALASVDRHFPEYTPEYTLFQLRPEVEARIPIVGEFQAVIGGGFQYAEGPKGAHKLNALATAGIQYDEYKLTVSKIFPDRNNGNERGYRVRFDYTKPGLISPKLGLRLSAEVDKGRSELLKFPSHPGYSGYVVTARAGLLIK